MSRRRAVVGSLILVVALTGCSNSSASPKRTPSAASTSSPTFRPQPPLRGPQIEDAHLFSHGRGYVVTAGHMLWTTNDGTTWQDITPPHTVPRTPGSLAVRPDGEAWVAVADSATGPVTVFHRASSTAGWQSTRVAASALNPDPYGLLDGEVSFIDPRNGWLLIGSNVTHSSKAELMRTRDGGSTWTLSAPASAVPGDGAITFVSATVGFLQQSLNGFYWTTDDGGHSWTRLNLPPPASHPRDIVSIVDPPVRTNAGTTVVAADIETPGQGTSDGLAIYTSTHGGRRWTIRYLPAHAGNAGYNFAASADDQAALTIAGPIASANQTWTVQTSTDNGHTFTSATSTHPAYADGLSVADPEHLWAIAQADGCRSFKANCYNTTGLFATADGGHTWHQLHIRS